MAVDSEVLIALKQAVQEGNQAEPVEKAIAAWLLALSEHELGHSENRRHLEAAKHAVNLPPEA
ncbi:MAG: hypothetical protein FD121_374 [Gallionellaceae bacterium]|nr:MAG: hypothetical protein FD121_374 [Gallionellaceae bacterium]